MPRLNGIQVAGVNVDLATHNGDMQTMTVAFQDGGLPPIPYVGTSIGEYITNLIKSNRLYRETIITHNATLKDRTVEEFG